MTSLATLNFKLSQLYPGAGEHCINTCANPDCSNFGHPLTGRATRKSIWEEKRPDLTPEQLKFVEMHGPGAYKLAGASEKHRRISRVFAYQNNPHVWSDQRTIRCLGQTHEGKICDSGFSILSPDHLDEEIDRLRNFNGVLDGPSCGACGKRFLDDPDEFALDGVHERSKDRKGQPVRQKRTPTSLRVLHKPCRGKKGARFSVSLPHAGQKTTADNLRILGAVLNSAGIVDVQRSIGIAGKKIGMSRIYDRIEWLEGVFLAYEREMLRRWNDKVEQSGKAVEHLLSHDDMVLTVNWETSTDRRNTQLNCAITADARSGYVYRLDVDFDPRATPLDTFNATYLDQAGMPQNLEHLYPNSKVQSAPKFSWQRPTGRYHEPQFFAACVNEIKAFQSRAKRRMPKKDKSQQAARSALIQRTKGMIANIRMISEGWFGFPIDESEERGSFKGMTTRDIYTKGAHFALLKEILSRGSIVLTTEQEATLPPLLPHIFDEEIREDRFAWMAMSFNKKATKPEKLDKVKEYRKARKQFHNDGMYAGRFDPGTDAQTVSEAFIADRMATALRGTAAHFQISNYQSEVFPALWVRSATQASGEIDKTVGFPILPRHMRRTLKKLPFDQEELSQDLREELAPWVYKATLQPVSSFMNSLRERMSVAARAGSGGARVGGSYVQGAIFNPRTLIALLNIYRVHYNFFEPRPYTCPYEEIDDLVDPPKLTPRALRIPGTDEFVDLPPRARRSRARMTPAMRHGMDAFTQRNDGTQDPPDIYRMLYRPWLYMGTKLGARFERSRGRQKHQVPASS
ncbi:hypothetical protein JSE7799_01387 [Jannaschia seosinensis]|uniref:Uncharacterized protein n=1 Tax=Jannaschia seosinensis TaxID=313367 RepID=A0A0M7B7I7_9RHOB|nr:hypothetical protein JSE7799_01387 [Jannaschia seosinensis]